MTNNNPWKKNNKHNRELAITMKDVGADTVEEELKVSEVQPEALEEEDKETIGELDELLRGITSKPKPPEKTQISVYLDPTVAKAFNKFGAKHGKGSKSELINDFLKKVLKVE